MSRHPTLLQQLNRIYGRMPVSARVAAACTALVLVLVFNAVIALQSSGRVNRQEEHVRQAIRIEARIDGVLASSQAMETGLRGYLISGDQGFLGAYTRASATIGQHLAELQVILLPDAQSPQLLDALKRDTETALGQAQRAIDSRRAIANAPPASSSSLIDQQEQRMAQVREHAEALRLDQAATLKSLMSGTDAARRDAQFLILIPSFVSVLLATFLSFLIVRDLRQRQRLEAERGQALMQERTARAEAEAASQAKDEFLSIISHELRTPLQTILGWTQLLKRTVDSRQPIQAGPLQSPVATIERSARCLAGMIDDLLDASGAISGRIGLSMNRVDLADVVRSAVELVGPTAQTKQVSLKLEQDSGELAINGDADRLRQVAINLIGNAVKFTPAGGTVRVTLRATQSGMELRVKDDGIGISAETIPRIFDRYMQGSVSTNRQYGGLGLGLAIVKHFVELHGGRVDAVSAGLGQGTEFVVVFTAMAASATPAAAAPTLPPVAVPRLAADLMASGPASVAPAGGQLAGIRLLVVDDDADVRVVLESLLGDEGAEVHTAASAEEGFEKLRRLRMDVILSDIGMPNTDGYVLARAVRGFGNAFSATPTTTPMIALTAFSRREDERRALDSGFNAHLGKPVEVDRLIGVLCSHFQRRSELATARAKVTPITLNR